MSCSSPPSSCDRSKASVPHSMASWPRCGSASARNRRDGRTWPMNGVVRVSASRRPAPSPSDRAATRDTRRAAAEQARLRLRETRDREAREVAERRALEEDVAVLTARRSALEALERDRVGLAPAAAALLAHRDRFDGRVLGPLADFISTDGDQAELADQLLGDFAHAVLVRDAATVAAVQEWHAAEQPGALILLPVEPGPAARGGSVDPRLRIDPVAADWIAALVGGSVVLEQSGRALRRANGAVYLTGPSASAGPIRRRAELKSLGAEVETATQGLAAVELRRGQTAAELAGAGDGDRRSRAGRRSGARVRTAGGRDPRGCSSPRREPRPRARRRRRPSSNGSATGSPAPTSVAPRSRRPSSAAATTRDQPRRRASHGAGQPGHAGGRTGAGARRAGAVAGAGSAHQRTPARRPRGDRAQRADHCRSRVVGASARRGN